MWDTTVPVAHRTEDNMLQSITYHTFLEVLGVVVLAYLGYMILAVPLAARAVARNQDETKKVIEEYFAERETRKTML